MIEATDETFAEILACDVPVVVDFWAEWCGPCKSFAPIFEEVATQYEGKVKFVKVDTDNTTLAMKHGIRGIPTVIIFKSSIIVNTIVGSMTAGRLKLAVDAVLA